MKKLINKNFAFLVDSYKSGYRGVVLEGGSRSGKTFAGVDFQLYLASTEPKKVIINNVRETYNSFKTTLYDDFNKRLTQLELTNPFENKDIQTFNLLNSKINFIGADKVGKVHGASSDFFFINEVLEGVEKSFFNQLEQRCRKFWWLDYNPSASDHWVFDLEKRPDVLFLRTTLLDNPFISINEKQKILSYDPTNEINIINGTADEYMWKVYGLGLRASPEGLIFDKVTLIDDLPESYDSEFWGIDFGFTNHPTAVTQVRKTGKNLYAKLHVYKPIDEPDVLAQLLLQLGENNIYWADSADGEMGMINQMRKHGIIIYAAKKPAGSVKAGISIMKNHNIHVVRNIHAEKEINNYKFRTINGFSLNEPIKKYDDFWDSFRYAVVSNCN